MCEPTTIMLLASAALSAVGAGVAKQGQDAAIINQAETNNRNTAEGYRVAQVNDRAAAAQAFEKQTDRSRKAARELSMARVLAAEGGASLEANAINISAAAAEDFSRIDTSLDNAHGATRSEMAALQTQNADALTTAQIGLKANSTKLGADLAGIAVSTGTKYFSKQSEKWIAEKHTDEATRRALENIEMRRVIPWAMGNKGMGD